VTFHLDIYRTASDLSDRNSQLFRTLAMFAAGLCWGAALGLLRVPLEATLSFALAIILFVTAVCIARTGIDSLHRHLQILATTCLVCIGLGIGCWLAG
jgi:hypothetical protein